MARVRGSAGTTRGFSNSINKWAKETEERATIAFQNISLEFFYALRRNTPVLSGNLRDSLVAGKKGTVHFLATGPGPSPNVSDNKSGEGVSIANIMSLQLGDKVEYIYQATYALRVNYGFVGTDILGRQYNQAGRFWIEQTGSQYRSIARRVATELKLQFR